MRSAAEHEILGKWGVEMARRGRTSIVREVKESIEAIDKIGTSKRTAREDGNSGIHSKKQKENTMSDCQNFVKWARSEHGVKSIADLNENHYRGYIVHLSEKGISEGHKINVETSLRLLEKGFSKRSERSESVSNRFEGFCPEKRLETRTRGLDVRNRAYTREEMQMIRENVSPEVSKAVDLMKELGLRVKEATNARVEHFTYEEQTDSWKFEIKKGEGAGITKGGRQREIHIPRHFETRLEQLLQGKDDKERVVNVSHSTIRDGINVACKKTGIEQAGRGAHGFRHAYARNRMDQLMTADQKTMMQRIIDNCSINRKADYGILSETDKTLYNATKDVMDQIHKELGHGKNRWELAMRYMGN